MPTLINVFAVPDEVDDEFVAGWQRARDFLAERDGYAATALHRSLAPQAEFRFVNVAEVNSVQAGVDPCVEATELLAASSAEFASALAGRGDRGRRDAILVSVFTEDR